MKRTAIQSAYKKIDNATLNPELTKSQVRKIANDLVKNCPKTTAKDLVDTFRTLSDKDMCAEDALDELKTTVMYLMEEEALQVAKEAKEVLQAAKQPTPQKTPRKEYKNYYFKDNGTHQSYMSGCSIPCNEANECINVDFVDCDIHPACLPEYQGETPIKYINCTFTNCRGGYEEELIAANIIDPTR